MDAVIGLRASDIGQTVTRLVCDREKGGTWGGPYVLSPIVITPDNYETPDVHLQWDWDTTPWWKFE